MSVSVEYSTKEISAIVLTNVLKMCERRNLINNVNSLFENLNVEFINKGEVEFESKNNNKYNRAVLRHTNNGVVFILDIRYKYKTKIRANYNLCRGLRKKKNYYGSRKNFNVNRWNPSNVSFCL